MLYRSGGFIHFLATAATPTFITNITNITKKYEGEDSEIMFLIERLKNSYQNIMSMPMEKSFK